ncbi:hypothetical protein BDV93DRAFT_460269 [Ceratobasidium sp. AG-I]|nr:hypothetical protein BDV93DRAFT_460269 [Ceratobasidium sp. AG-I]
MGYLRDLSVKLEALGYLSEVGLSLSKLLNDVLLGDQTIQSNRQVMAARTELFKSSVIPQTLSRICKPPAGMRMRGKARSAAKDALEKWALETSKDILRKELVTYTATTKAPQTESDVVSDESLKEMTFDALVEQIETHAPRLYGLLSHICMATRRDIQRQKDSKFCITIFINALANQISQLNNRMQKLLCIYFKAKSVPKSVYHLFYRCGVVKSYSWSVKALVSISDAAMAKAVDVFEHQPCLVIHDNIRLPFAVKHQRGDHLTTTDNGTAITMMPLRDPVRAAKLLWDPELWDKHRLHIAKMYHNNTMRHFSAQDLFALPGFLCDRERTISNILCFLFETPLKSKKRQHKLLAELPPVCQLPYGPSHCNQQYMLQSIPQEEASYGGNYAITQEVPRQLGLESDEDKEEWARAQKLPWIGDSLTIQHQRGLKSMKCEDTSSQERLEHIIPTFGWFHLDMNLVNGIFYHHYAEDSTYGLARDAAALHRSGLTKPTKKRGPQYHTGDEFLRHTTTARMRELWLWATKASDKASLVHWVEESSPELIQSTAQRIWSERVSNRAIETFKDSNPGLCNTIALSRDLLLRHEVWTSIRQGDVGRMENTLPALLVFFLGAGASNYAKEIAEVLHWRQYEAPPGVADLIRDECWVLNMRGLKDTFYPFDLRQELNNLAIKHGPPPQGCTWEAHRKWAPALPILTGVVQHVDECFHDFYRSRRHYVPDPEQDIKLLIARHTTSKIHEHQADPTKVKQDKRTVDCSAAGRVKLANKYLDGLAQERTRYLTYSSTLEIARHEGQSVDEIINKIRENSELRDASALPRSLQGLANTLQQAEEDEIDEDELLFEDNEQERMGQDEYEAMRHQLTNLWDY